MTENLQNQQPSCYHFLFLQVCRLTRLVETSSSSATSQLSTRLTSLRSTLATQLPPRVLLPTLTKCYSSMVVDKKVGSPSVCCSEQSVFECFCSNLINFKIRSAVTDGVFPRRASWGR